MVHLPGDELEAIMVATMKDLDVPAEQYERMRLTQP